MRRRRGEAPRTTEAFLSLLTAAGLSSVAEPPLPDIAPLVIGDHLGPILRRREAWAKLASEAPTGAFSTLLRQRFQRLATAGLAKPTLALLGQSDAGKSRLINAFLGSDLLTASWTPTTSIPVFIKHRRERPAWMGEDEAWVFGGDWDPSRWLDQEYAQSRKLAGGDRSVLYQWGTRQGGRGLGMAGAAILFAESDLLLSCDVVDLPGIGAPDRPEEEAHARGALRWADALLYLSPANSFMKATDLAFLAEAMRGLPALPGLAPWASVFVVAAQAGGVEGGNKETLTRILDLGASRLAHVLIAAGIRPEATTGTNGPVAAVDPAVRPTSRQALAEALRPRFFTYALERPDLRADLESALPPLLAALPKALAQRADQLLPAFQAEALTDLTRERERLTALINVSEAHRWARDTHRQELRQDLRAALGATATRSRHQFLAEAEAQLEAGAIRTLIETQHLSPTEAPETLPALLGLRLQSSAEALLSQSFAGLCPVIDRWVAALPPAAVGFEVERALAEALAEAAALGGLALWGAQRGVHATPFHLARPEPLLQGLRPAGSAPSGWAGRIGGLFTRLVGGSDWAAKLAQQVATQAAETETAERFAQALIDTAWAETEAGLAALTLSVEEAISAWAARLESPPEQTDQEAELVALGIAETWLRGLN